MPNDYTKITLSANSTKASDLLGFVESLRNAYEAGKHLQTWMLHNTDGSNFTTIEAALGLPAGKGQGMQIDVNTIVGVFQGDFQASTAKDMPEKTGL